jgi:hypothetical protein
MGYWTDKKPKPENFATKDDVKELDRKLEKLLKQEQPQTTMGAARKVVGGISKGINDVARSLNTSNSGKRMRIGNMPDRKPPIARTKVHNPIAGESAGMKRHRISNAPLD